MGGLPDWKMFSWLISSVLGPLSAAAALSFSIYILFQEYGRSKPASTTPKSQIPQRANQKRFDSNLVTHHQGIPRFGRKQVDRGDRLDYNRWDKVDWEHEAEKVCNPVKAKPYTPKGLTSQSGSSSAGGSEAIKAMLQQLAPTVLSPFAVKKYQQHQSRGFLVLRTSQPIDQMALIPPEERSVTVRYVKQGESEGFFKETGDSQQLREYLTTAMEGYDPQSEMLLCVAQPAGESGDSADPKQGTCASMKVKLTASFEKLSEHETYKSEVLKLIVGDDKGASPME